MTRVAPMGQPRLSLFATTLKHLLSALESWLRLWSRESSTLRATAMAGTGEGSASIITRWIPMSPSTQRLVLVGAGSCALTIAAVLSTQHLHRIHNRRKLRDQVEKRARPTKGNRSTTEQSQYSLQSSPKPPLNPDDLNDDDLAEEDELTDFTRPPNAQPNSRPPAQPSKQRQVSPVIINEALARNYVFFSEQGMHKIRNSFVVIVGLGGVGSAAALMLVRSGVKKVRLIDFDQVSLSSLNVSAVAVFLYHDHAFCLLLTNQVDIRPDSVMPRPPCPTWERPKSSLVPLPSTPSPLGSRSTLESLFTPKKKRQNC